MGPMTERDMRAVALGMAVGAALTPAGVGRANDSADLDARSQDMVAEGGPDGA